MPHFQPHCSLKCGIIFFYLREGDSRPAGSFNGKPMIWGAVGSNGFVLGRWQWLHHNDYDFTTESYRQSTWSDDGVCQGRDVLMSIKSQTKDALAIVWSRPGNVCQGRDRVIRNLVKVIHSVANPQPAPSYTEPGRNWVRLQVSKTGELPMLRARNNVVDFLVRYSSKISEISWVLTCHIVHLHLNRWILKDVTLAKVIVP